MKIYENVLSDETLDIIHTDIDRLKNNDCWSVGSLITWGPQVKKNITGVVVSCKLSEEIPSIIKKELEHIIPQEGELLLNYNIWYPNSGIAWHNDGRYAYGFTLYLNHNWDINWGGLFMWEDKKTNEYKMFPPEYNSLILNDETEYHAVSVISPTATNYRLTIQGFCRS